MSDAKLNYLTILDYLELEKRGARMKEADFRLVKCTVCGSYALCDEEVMIIYLDPGDLSNQSLYGTADDLTSSACLSCGALNSFDEISLEDLDAIRRGPWSYVLA